MSTLHTVKTVQIVLEEDLLRAADRAARKQRMNRSAFVREALRAHLHQQRRRELEAAHRDGYESKPPVEFDVWDTLAAWPED